MGFINPRTAGVDNGGIIERKIITTPVSSVQFANLAGNSSTFFRIRGFVKCETVETGVMILGLSLNEDTSGTNGTDGNYRDFTINLDAVPDGTTAEDQNEFGVGGGSLVPGQYYLFECEIFAKGGYTNHAIKSETHNPDASTGKTLLVSGSWDMEDEITSIEIFAGGGTLFDGATWTGELELSYSG